ncbi:MAG: sortase [Acidimicrobiales bacterium]|nr:sortase [Acidimicrobiales bacterium]
MSARKVFLGLLVAVVGVALATPTAGASPTDLDPGVLVRVINTNPASSNAVVDVTLGDATPQSLGFGSATTFARLPANPVINIGQESVRLETASAGCLVTVILVEPDNDGRQWREFPECSASRVAPGAASLRFINATADSGTVQLDDGTAGDGSPAEPYSSSERHQALSGRLDLRALSPSGEQLGDRTVEAAPDTAYTALWAGGAETPLRLLWVEDGRQPHDSPPPEIPIDTDAPAAPHGPHTAAIAAGLSALAVTAALLVRRRPTTVLALLLLASGCAPKPQAESTPPTAPAEPTATTVTPSPDEGEHVGLPAFVSAPTADIDGAITPVDRDAGASLPDDLRGDAVAWFEGSARPGELGTALLAGHVVWGGSDGVFADLDQLDLGSPVIVDDELGERHPFTVQGWATIPKGALDPGLFSFSPEPRLLLVTCTGPIDQSRGLRTSNLLVWAVAASTPSVVSTV